MSGLIGGLFGGGGGGGGGSIQAPPATPTLNQAITTRMAEDQNLVARGRATTLLTSNNGLPNLGATIAPSAGSGG